MSVELTDDALRAIERGEPIYRVSARLVERNAEILTIEASHQFWFACASALRNASEVAPETHRDAFRATYALLCRTAGLVADEGDIK